MTDERLLWFLEGEAEASEEAVDDIEVTPEVREAVEVYEAELYAALMEFVGTESGWSEEKVEEFVDELMDEDWGDAPANVLLTLQGSGAGIWDGRWDDYFEERQIKQLQRFLKQRLGRFADDTGGGSLSEAFREAVAVPEGADFDDRGPEGFGQMFGRPEEEPSDDVGFSGRFRDPNINPRRSEGGWYREDELRGGRRR